MNNNVNEIVGALVADFAAMPGGLLPLLHAVQDRLGYIPPSSVPLIARGLNLSRAEVHGVITYYHHFRQAPAGKHVVQVCCAESCQACGSEALLAAASTALGCAPGTTRADGAVTLEPVYCLGLCAASPAVQIDAALHARVTPEALHGLLAKLEDVQ
ncbi:formate dehydrogenase subunit gamma [Massilia sp. TS11]|uniref:formate dehydrogenase subunit gamma n=1 Tax=Massilia sp. TS11 TaxID=2908003 RepID=UPI001EDBA611|nr:formate dehydrogenase subunit gamma [Massilia sp. TS11]MCG2584950.1 formate dehydrogenase subunit gamma [Massilia sp. TS11]